MPMVEYPGMRAMQKVETDMMTMESDRALRLPSLSPMWPQKKPPRGRTKKEMAKTPKVASSAVCRSASGKNTEEITAAR